MQIAYAQPLTTADEELDNLDQNVQQADQVDISYLSDVRKHPSVRVSTKREAREATLS